MRIVKTSSSTSTSYAKPKKIPTALENYSKSFSDELSSTYLNELENLKKELEKFDENLDKNFSENDIEQYRNFIKSTIMKIYSTIKIVEKLSGKKKDKVLKVIEVSNENLKKILDEIISKNVNKLKLKGLVNELKGIIISLTV